MDASRPKFTIALPVRNGGHHLRLCVESILAQTHGEFTLAILDNASDDDGAEFLRGLRDPRITICRSERPLSIEENWARILTVPKGDYLTAIGHDDLLDPDFLEVISRLIEQHPDAGLYMTHFRLIDEHGAFLRHCRPMPERETAAEFVANRLCDTRDLFGTGYVMRSTVYGAVGGFPPFPKLLYADDALFFQAIGQSYRATALEEAFSYRQHAVSVSKRCAMSELFAALEGYGALLARTRDRDGDPVLAEVLRRYFPGYAAMLGRLWRDEELRSACRTRHPLDPELGRRIERLVTLFDERPQLAPASLSFESRLLDRATHSRVHHILYEAWRAQRAGLKRARGWLARRLA